MSAGGIIALEHLHGMATDSFGVQRVGSDRIHSSDRMDGDGWMVMVQDGCYMDPLLPNLHDTRSHHISNPHRRRSQKKGLGIHLCDLFVSVLLSQK